MRHPSQGVLGRFAAGAAVLLIVAACGSSSPTVGTPSGIGYQPHSIAVSTTAGDVIASQEIEPGSDSVVEGKGPDGTDYELDIPAFALTDPTTISMRALKPVAIPGGQLASGVELAPEGTTFMLPVSLKITPASGDAANLVPFQYTGSPDVATASLTALKANDPGSVELWLEHFSGAFVAKAADAQSESNWAAIPPAPLGGTAAERSAWAQAVIVAAQFDLDTGLHPDMKADDEAAVDHAWDILVKAEVEIAGDKGNQDKVKAGQIKDAAEVLAGLEALGQKALERHLASPCKAGSSALEALQPMLDAKDEYFKNVMKSADADKTFQQLLADGKPSDSAYMDHLLSTFLTAMRWTQVLGATADTDRLMNAKLHEWTTTYGVNLVSKTPPTTDANLQKIVEIMHKAAALGDDAVLQAGPCLPIPDVTCPPHGQLLPGAYGAQLADANICSPAPSGPSTPPLITPPDAPISDRVTITGHGETDGLSSDLGSGSDGKSIADLSVQMDVQEQEIGGIVHVTSVSGTYTITGSVSGDCVGSGSESGAMTKVESDQVTNDAGNVGVRVLSMSVHASAPVHETCSSRAISGGAVVKDTNSTPIGLDLSSCDLSSGKGTYTCTGIDGSQWSIEIARG